MNSKELGRICQQAGQMGSVPVFLLDAKGNTVGEIDDAEINTEPHRIDLHWVKPVGEGTMSGEVEKTINKMLGEDSESQLGDEPGDFLPDFDGSDDTPFPGANDDVNIRMG